jgi:hypothetical protein
VLAGAIYAALAYLVFRRHWLPEGIVSWSYILGVPLIIGAVCVGLSGRALQKNILYCCFAPWLPIVLVYVVLAVIKVETLICLIMLAPSAFGCATIGGALAGVIARQLGPYRSVMSCIALAPLLFVRIEAGQEAHQVIHTVTNRVVIAAPPERVWSALLNVPDIRPEELRWSFSHAIGLPRPRAALLSGSGIGSVRDLYWEGDIHFREYVTEWDPRRRLAYRVDVSPARESLRRLDTHVVIGDRYFDIQEGEYRLRDLGTGQTELSLSTTYRMRTMVNPYGEWWANRTLDDFHTVVLKLIQKRTE